MGELARLIDSIDRLAAAVADASLSRRQLLAVAGGCAVAAVAAGCSQTVEQVTSPGPSQGSPSAEPTEAPATPEETWRKAFDSRDQDQIDAWYDANTGHTVLGLTDADLWDIGGPLDITDQWLAANDGKGHVSRSGDRWLVEAIRCRGVIFRADDVTVRGAVILQPTLYGAAYKGAHHGAVLEYATLDGQGSEHFAHYFAADRADPDTTTVRNCRISGFRSGGPLLSGTTIEHTLVHDLHLFGDAHNTSATVRGSHVKVRRNNFKDGTSSAMSIYADEPIDDVLVEENVLNTPNANWCLNFPRSKAYAATTTNTRFVDNLFGQEFFAGCGSSGPQTGLELFTLASGNRLMDGTPVG